MRPRALPSSSRLPCVVMFAVAACVGALAAAAAEPGPQLMPPHPAVLARIAAEGYDSVTLVNLRRLADLKRGQGIDQPEQITAGVTGTRPALVLLVEYSDLTHDPASTPACYDDMLFSAGTYPAPGSMRDFYWEASYGLFDISPSLVDGAWRQTGKAHTYYADSDGIFGTYDDYGFGPGGSGWAPLTGDWDGS